MWGGTLWRHRRRAGWSGVSLSSYGPLNFSWYGTCSDRCPSAHRAELRAILRALERAVPPLVVYTDHNKAVDDYGRGEEFCCSSARPAADLWRRIWRRVDELRRLLSDGGSP